jgi:hypothetical protein
MKPLNVFVLSVLALHLLIGAPAVTAGGSDPSEAATSGSDVQPLPGRGPLEAGSYYSTAVGPQMTFSVGDGWAVGNLSAPGLGFSIGPRSGGHLLTLTRFDGTVMIEPCFTPERSMDLFEAQGAESAWLADPANQTAVDASVQGFWDHLAANPYLTVGDLVEVDIGGLSGLQADVTATVAEEDCFPRHTVLWNVPAFEAWILQDEAQARYTALEVDGTVVIVAAESAPGLSDHEAQLERDDAMLETLAITPAEPTSEG